MSHKRFNEEDKLGLVVLKIGYKFFKAAFIMTSTFASG